MFFYCFWADGVYIVYGGSESNDSFYIGGAAFEFVWGLRVDCFLFGDFLDHVAAD